MHQPESEGANAQSNSATPDVPSFRNSIPTNNPQPINLAPINRQPTNRQPVNRQAINHQTIHRQPVGTPMLPTGPELALQPSFVNHAYPSLGMGSFGMGNLGGFGYGGLNNPYGMGGMGMGSPFGGYNRFGQMYGGDIESRFVQIAEERSRPAFESIQSLVNAVGSVSMMLEHTFFALFSSFRAILGVAENFGRLRTLFAQFWSTFAVVRTLNWLIRKLLVMLGIRTEAEFRAWAEAVAATQTGHGRSHQKTVGSSWPILLFFGVIAAAPYIVLKMLNGLSTNIQENLKDPSSWQNPLRAVTQYEFHANTPQQLSFRANQMLLLAPQHLQGHLWNSGWLMATPDKRNAGLVPTNYIKVIRPTITQSQTPTPASNASESSCDE